MLKSKILFQMTGSIACYKACNIISKLVQAGHEVQVVASPAALEFVGQATLEGLSQRPVISDLFERGNIMDHIHLVRWADLIIVAPATANYINKISQGIGDDLLTTQFLAHDFKKPFLLAPAMNTAMYLHPVTQGSIKKLREMGIEILEAASGVLACGEVGWGRLLDPDLIFKEIETALGKTSTSAASQPSAKPTKAMKVLITSGGTQEPIDKVRVLSNISTGSTGAQLAETFAELGFEVTYLHAKNAILPKNECSTMSFYTFNDLDQKLKEALSTGQYSAVVHAAAVSDFSIQAIETSSGSIQAKDEGKISSDSEVTLKLSRNPKLLDKIRDYAKNPSLLVVAFKMTATEEKQKQTSAVQKVFEQSRADFVVHNDMGEIDASKGKHIFHLYKKQQNQAEILESKQALGQKLGLVIFEELNKRSL